MAFSVSDDDIIAVTLLHLISYMYKTRSTGTVHTSAKARLTSVVIRIRISASGSVIRIATKI